MTCDWRQQARLCFIPQGPPAGIQNESQEVICGDTTSINEIGPSFSTSALSILRLVRNEPLFGRAIRTPIAPSPIRSPWPTGSALWRSKIRAAGAAISHLGQLLPLFVRQDFGELGIDMFLQRADSLSLICREIQHLLNKGGQYLANGWRTTRATRATRTTGASGTTRSRETSTSAGSR